MRLARLVALLPLVLLGCRTEDTLVAPDPHLERMLVQQKRLPYQEDPMLPQGMVMQLPPDGTLSVETHLGDPLVERGIAGGRWAETIPISLDRGMLDEGRRHFETFCAACHGERGDGDSPVARRMALRTPQDLLADKVRAYPPGRLFQTVRQGYGMMPSYSVQLGVRETWGVVGYLHALQLAQGVRAADLPADVRAELAKEAP